MFIFLLSPGIAFIADYLMRRHKLNTRWAVLLIVLLITPSILIEFTGYSFSCRLHSYIATTLFLTGAQLAVFTIVNVRQSVKLFASILFLAILGLIVLGGSFLGEWGGGSRIVIKQAQFHNYKALTLEPSLYSTNKTLRVKKTAFAGLFQKIIYEQDLPDTATKTNCDINFRDGGKKFVFDFCKNTLGAIN